jgi:hypothetical protein
MRFFESVEWGAADHLRSLVALLCRDDINGLSWLFLSPHRCHLEPHHVISNHTTLSQTTPLSSRTPPLSSRTPPQSSQTPPLSSRTPPLSSRTNVRDLRTQHSKSQIAPGHTFAINQGPFMGVIIFRKREHVFERQRVVRTLKMIAAMGPIAKVWPGVIRTHLASCQSSREIPRRCALSG